MERKSERRRDRDIWKEGEEGWSVSERNSGGDGDRGERDREGERDKKAGKDSDQKGERWGEIEERGEREE